PWHRAFAEVDGDEAIVHPVNIVDDVRWHAGFAYVDPARSRPNLTILPETLVDRVLLADGRAVGVSAAGHEVEAEVVVVAGGAYGSPGILLRSGIGPAEELARYGIPAVADLPVGEGLAGHVGTRAGWMPTEVLSRETEEHESRHSLDMALVTPARRS